MNFDEPEPPRMGSAQPVVYDGREYPSKTELARHLAAPLGITAKAVRHRLDRVGWAPEAIAALAAQSLPLAGTGVEAPPEPEQLPLPETSPARVIGSGAGLTVTWRGHSFPSRKALIRHLAGDLGMKKGAVQGALYKHGFGNDDIEAALVELRSSAPPDALPAPASNGADVLASVEHHPPAENGIAEVFEKLGIFWGQFETQEAEIAGLKQQLELLRELPRSGTDPALARRIEEITAQLAQQDRRFDRIERQMATEAERRAKLSEVVNLINVKLTQHLHDMRKARESPPPPPTRRRPLG
jgi:ribosomal protein S24E